MSRRRPHRYAAYELCIASDLAVPWLPAGPDRAPDLTIRLGAVPGACADANAFWEAGPGVFRLNVDGVARYLVTGGDDILVEPAGGDDREVAVFLVGSVRYVPMRLWRRRLNAGPPGRGRGRGAPAPARPRGRRHRPAGRVPPAVPRRVPPAGDGGAVDAAPPRGVQPADLRGAPRAGDAARGSGEARGRLARRPRGAFASPAAFSTPG